MFWRLKKYNFKRTDFLKSRHLKYKTKQIFWNKFLDNYWERKSNNEKEIKKKPKKKTTKNKTKKNPPKTCISSFLNCKRYLTLKTQCNIWCIITLNWCFHHNTFQYLVKTINVYHPYLKIMKATNNILTTTQNNFSFIINNIQIVIFVKQWSQMTPFL